ncbi:MAG: tyrosine-type recombinase/integrase [Aliivibrio sp.]|uniref:tyrosine-type recombinase/integrase n=1 Tax=Aliivibrio sp. TaxID=1872443 RepID=UPI001A4C8B92|nr:tyrosine-type recombinase/integrase [Aliivibrio sp.]
MLTDTVLRNLKPQGKPYKIADRDGMYVSVSKTGLVTFRYDYRINGRRETITIGRYGRGGISLFAAREKCMDAHRAVKEGRSPAHEKKREKQRLKKAHSFGGWAELWLEEGGMADSTKAMRKSIFVRDMSPVFGGRLLKEITSEDLRMLCEKVKARGAPATAIHVRDILKQVYSFAALKGEKHPNPANEVMPASIATFRPKDRSLSPKEIRILYRILDNIAADAVLKLGLKLILLTMKRKSEVTYATWDEVDFEEAVWVIPKERMKTRYPHVIYLSQQALDIMVALKTCAGGSRYLFPSRYDPDRCISNATFNRITKAAIDMAEKEGVPLEHFTVHDLRRTGSTLLNELGFNRDWIEKCLAHEDSSSSRGIYNKAGYAQQRRHMLQEWANMIDAWVEGRKYKPALLPEEMSIYEADPLL